MGRKYEKVTDSRTNSKISPKCISKSTKRLGLDEVLRDTNVIIVTRNANSKYATSNY